MAMWPPISPKVVVASVTAIWSHERRDPHPGSARVGPCRRAGAGTPGGQWFSLDLTLLVDCQAAARSDALTDTADYNPQTDFFP